MEAITYTQARGNLSKTIERVCSNHDPVIITKKNEAVVMLSLEDYEALQETAYLLRSPANAQRLLDAMHAVESGKGKTVEALCDA